MIALGLYIIQTHVAQVLSMTLKINLVSFMKNRKISIKDLSIDTGISEPTLKRLRTQPDANPTLDVLIRLSDALNVSVNELIEQKSGMPVFSYPEKINLPKGSSEFMIIFTQNCFSFKAGSKAIFRKYAANMSITKYIVNKQGKLFEKISDDQWLFRDEEHHNYSVNKNFIFAVILKELYEVSYV